MAFQKFQSVEKVEPLKKADLLRDEQTDDKKPRLAFVKKS